MKKIISILLTACILLSMVAMLFSCGNDTDLEAQQHECVFSEDWTKNTPHHWRACTTESCAEKIDKGEHVWDDGQITSKATQEAPGVKTFTCTTCAQTKTEAIEFTGLSEEEWNIALSEFAFENVTYEETATTNYGAEVGTIKYKFTEDVLLIKNRTTTTSNKRYTDEDEIEEIRKALVDSIRDIAPYESYQYDAETQTYKSTERIYIEALKTSTTNITLKFENGKLAEIKYLVQVYPAGADYVLITTAKLWDYGTTLTNSF